MKKNAGKRNWWGRGHLQGIGLIPLSSEESLVSGWNHTNLPFESSSPS